MSLPAARLVCITRYREVVRLVDVHTSIVPPQACFGSHDKKRLRHSFVVDSKLSTRIAVFNLHPLSLPEQPCTPRRGHRSVSFDRITFVCARDRSTFPLSPPSSGSSHDWIGLGSVQGSASIRPRPGGTSEEPIPTRRILHDTWSDSEGNVRTDGANKRRRRRLHAPRRDRGCVGASTSKLKEEKELQVEGEGGDGRDQDGPGIRWHERPHGSENARGNAFATAWTFASVQSASRWRNNCPFEGSLGTKGGLSTCTKGERKKRRTRGRDSTRKGERTEAPQRTIHNHLLKIENGPLD